MSLEVCAIDRAPIRMDVTRVHVPGGDGAFTVLLGHTPLLSTLELGVVEVTLTDGSEVRIAVNQGFVRVLDNEVLLLAQTAERADEIDVERAEAARVRAEQRLKKADLKCDFARAEFALKRAINRLRTVNRI
jgi:F-type H+-transporting ATPase subunit epsilon